MNNFLNKRCGIYGINFFKKINLKGSVTNLRETNIVLLLVVMNLDLHF